MSVLCVFVCVCVLCPISRSVRHFGNAELFDVSCVCVCVCVCVVRLKNDR